MKKAILIISIFLLCGCSVEYNVNINENFKVDDEFILTSKYEEFEENKPDYWLKFFGRRMSESEFVNPLFEEFSDYIQTSTKKYKDFKEYSNYEYLRKYVDSIINNEKEHKLSIVFNNKFKEDVYENEKFKELIININFPYTVLKSNSTSEKDNIYTWKLNKENKLNEIYIEYRNPQILKTTNNILFKVIMFGSIIALIILIYSIYKKYQKNNAL